MEIAYDERGLVPVVVQDWRTGEVLTLAYANAEAVRRTRARPGSCTSGAARATSCGTRARRRGNTQAVRALRLDCDGDALLALVEPAGPACHTGERTCFHHGELEPPAPHEALPVLERTLARRAAERPEGSYTVDAARRPRARRARRCARRPRRSRAPRARRATSASTRRRPTSCTTCRPAARARALADRRPGRARWPSRLTPPRCRSSPRSTRSARSRATTTSSRCATPSSTTARRRSSAFLKLRGREPQSASFLLESAEQGQQVGRYSFIGVRPRKVVRWSLGDEPATRTRSPPTRSPATARRRWPDLPPFAGGAVGYFGYDLVRTVERARRAQPGSGRPARHGAHAVRRPRRLRPPQAHDHDPRQRLRRRRRRHRLRTAYDDAVATIAQGARAARGPRPAPGGDARAAAPAVHLEHDARAVRGHGRADRRVRPRRRRVPGRAVAALVGRPRHRPVLDLSRAARRQPVARTCTSSTSWTSRSPAPRPSRC